MRQKLRDSTRSWNKERQALKNMTTSTTSKDTKDEKTGTMKD